MFVFVTDANYDVQHAYALFVSIVMFISLFVFVFVYMQVIICSISPLYGHSSTG